MTFHRNWPITLLALAGLAVVPPTHAAAQIFKVPTETRTSPPVTVSLGAGLLIPGSRYDATDAGSWFFTEAIQYRAKVDWSLRSGSVGIVGTTANVPVRRPAGDDHVGFRQVLVSLRSPYAESFGQTFEFTGGWSQWSGSGGARNGVSAAIGYGAAFPVGRHVTFSFTQDAGIIVGSAKGLPSGQSRIQRLYTTRLELSLHARR